MLTKREDTERQSTREDTERQSTRDDRAQVCPICRETVVRQISCVSPSCAFVVTTCPRCDREQAVRAFVDDHERGCVPVLGTPSASRPTFAAPRRVA